MKQYFIYIAVLATALVVSCSNKHEAAQQRLVNARAFLAQHEFEKAKAELDSIQILDPKAFDQRHAAVPLLDSIRRAENYAKIMAVDMQLVELEPLVANLKADFVYQKDAKYQETGDYVPKSIAGSGVIAFTTLHAGVEESGRVYLESKYIGSQKHNKVKVTSGNLSAETLAINGDGYVHRFSDLGKNYEVIRIVGNYENGVAKFIAENAKSTIKVELQGAQSTSYTLPNNIKNAISQSYNLSVQMLLLDSLKTDKERAEFKNYYLDNDKQLTKPIEE